MEYLKVIETDFAFLGLREDEVIYLYMKDHFMLDLDMQNWLLIAYRYLCEDEKFPIITEAGEFIQYKSEVVPFMREYIDEFPILSNSLIVKNTAHMIIASFFTRFIDSPLPLKIFRNKEKAIEWALENRRTYVASKMKQSL
ncbi:MAG: hypothetical protein R2780_02105 [Crocinitomicaceae bacterium]|nr:hypothetical protein [Crocinitomicaceae bacterium]